MLDKRENTLYNGAFNLSTCDYTVNSPGQRTGVNMSGSAFAANGSCVSSCDTIGQLTAATHGTAPVTGGWTSAAPAPNLGPLWSMA